MDHFAYFRRLYVAFNRRDVDTVLAMMSDGVDCRTLGRAAAWQGTRPCGTTGPRNGPRLTLTSNRSRQLSVSTVLWPSESGRWCADSTGNSSGKVRWCMSTSYAMA